MVCTKRKLAYRISTCKFATYLDSLSCGSFFFVPILCAEKPCEKHIGFIVVIRVSTPYFILLGFHQRYFIKESALNTISCVKLWGIHHLRLFPMSDEIEYISSTKIQYHCVYLEFKSHCKLVKIVCMNWQHNWWEVTNTNMSGFQLPISLATCF